MTVCESYYVGGGEKKSFSKNDMKSTLEGLMKQRAQFVSNLGAVVDVSMCSGALAKAKLYRTVTAETSRSCVPPPR